MSTKQVWSAEWDTMRKTLIVTAFLLISGAADAQVLIALVFGDALNSGKVEFGLDGGVNLVSIAGADQAQHMWTWNLGFYFDIKLPDSAWMIHTGVIVKSTMGTENLPVYPLEDDELNTAFSGGSVATRLQYFEVPIMIKYKLNRQFYIEGAPCRDCSTKRQTNLPTRLKKRMT